MLISRKHIITDSVIKNLLSAHKRIADQGKVSEIIRLSKFLFRLVDQGKDVLVDVFPEGKQEWCPNPVDSSKSYYKTQGIKQREARAVDEPLMRIIEEAGVTVDEVANFVGVSSEDVLDWCSGRVTPHALQVVKLSMVTLCDMKDIYLAIIRTPFPAGDS